MEIDNYMDKNRKLTHFAQFLSIFVITLHHTRQELWQTEDPKVFTGSMIRSNIWYGMVQNPSRAHNELPHMLICLRWLTASFTSTDLHKQFIGSFPFLFLRGFSFILTIFQVCIKLITENSKMIILLRKGQNS